MTADNVPSISELVQRNWEECAIKRSSESFLVYFAKITAPEGKILYGYINQGSTGFVSGLSLPLTYSDGYYPYDDEFKKSNNELIKRMRFISKYNRKVVEWNKSPSIIYNQLGTVWVDRNDPDAISNGMEGNIANRRLLIFNELNEIDLQTLISKIEERNPWNIEPLSIKELEELKK